MPLQEFLQYLDIEEINKIRKRALVVGRFSYGPEEEALLRDGKTPDPKLFLFKHPNRAINDTYKARFNGGTGSFGDMRSFFELLRPTVYESRERERDITGSTLVAPVHAFADGTETRPLTLNEHNFWLVRAAATSAQPAFSKKEPSFGLPQTFLAKRNDEQGKEVYHLLRQHLLTFGTFQPRVLDVVDAFSAFFGEFGTWKGLPPYGQGDSLPPGFPAALVNYLFSVEDGMPFSLADVDVTDDRWKELRTPAAASLFCHLVEIFVDCLLQRRARHSGTLKGNRPVATIAETAISVYPRLMQETKAAGDAIKSLRQLLEGKILGSMVLKWVLDSLDQIPDVKGLPNQKGIRDRAKGRAVMERYRENGLAQPVPRAAPEARAEFQRSLKLQTDVICRVVAEFPDVLSRYKPEDLDEVKAQEIIKEIPDADKEKLQSQLTLPLLKNAITLSKEESIRLLFQKLNSKTLGPEYRRAFGEMLKMMMCDHLCPQMFRDPGLTRATLEDEMWKQMMAVYVTSVVLDAGGQNAFERMGREMADEAAQIGTVEEGLKKADILKAKVIAKSLRMIATQEFRDRLESVEKVLADSCILLPKLLAKMSTDDRPRWSFIMPLVSDAVYRRSDGSEPSASAATDLSTDDLLAVVKTIADEKAAKVIRAAKAKLRAQATHSTEGTPLPNDSQSAGQPNTGAEHRTHPETTDQAQSDGVGSATEQNDSQSAGQSNTGAEHGTHPETTDQAQSDGVGSATEQKVEERLSATLAEMWTANPPVDDGTDAVADEMKEQLVRETVTRIKTLHENQAPKTNANASDLLTDMKDSMRALQSAYHLIYSIYTRDQTKNTKPESFQNRVDQLTLMNLMLLFQKRLGLGDMDSSLLKLLLDLVLQMDRTSPDPLAFLAQCPLNTYFSDDRLKEHEFTRLTQVIENMTAESFDFMANFASDIMGVRHLFECVRGDMDAEVLIINATADEFKNWLRADNLPGAGANPFLRMQPTNLLRGHQDQSTICGLVYITDLAFGYNEASKKSFVESLKAIAPLQGATCFIPPPICISTGLQGDVGTDNQWQTQAEALALAAKDARCAVYVVGPSSRLNSLGDAYRTSIPAGYILAAHVLAQRAQGIENQNLDDGGLGRFFKLGYGGVDMRQSLDCVIWGRSAMESVMYAGDHYLYLVLLVQAAAKYGGFPHGANVVAKRLYESFYNPRPTGLADHRFYDESSSLDNAVFWPVNGSMPADGHRAYHYSLGTNIAAGGPNAGPVTLEVLHVLAPGTSEWTNITDIDWFNHTRVAARLD